MHLTPEQLQLFRHNGFIKLPQQLPEDTVEQLKETIWQHINEKIEPIVQDWKGRIVRLSDIWDRAPIFNEAMTSPLALEPLESLLGPNIELILNRHNHATLRLADERGGMSVGLHRDVMQWTRTIVTIIFYLEETTLVNGCTHVIPGSHLLPDASGLKDQAVAVPMPAGGMIALDSMMLHAAGQNQTDGTRMSMTVGYHSVDELIGMENPKKVLVRGERVYRGNDRQ
jgi:phytanoyl-CoA hydroxylase